ncbi:nucleocapsid protein [Fox fecal rhabdovirus]|uniref:Nucleocapsid protein n=1 Tax=Fox fecal rhabdovirus TaxID=1504569 RepID=A0A060D117_9RHAB|nr:nucleocapsid protein [Fox fecal rhabdovirus]AIB06805.1 nucleocapsid protein [Fox fecal rhabdovirus]
MDHDNEKPISYTSIAEVPDNVAIGSTIYIQGEPIIYFGKSAATGITRKGGAQKDWTKDMIRGVRVFLPQTDANLLNLIAGETEAPELEKYTIQDPEKKGILKKFESKWEFANWANLLVDLQSNTGNIPKGRFPYYSALFSITAIKGAPVLAPAMKDLGDPVYVKAPDDLHPPTGDIEWHGDKISVDEAAYIGYGAWLIMPRFTIKAESKKDEIAASSKAFDTLRRLLPEITKPQVLVSVVTQLRLAYHGTLVPGSAYLAAEVAMRRAMNIEYDLKADRTECKAGEHFPGCQLRVLQDIPQYDSGFWGFGQVGLEMAGYSALNMLHAGLDIYGKTIADLRMLINWRCYDNYIADEIKEGPLLADDPWRAASYLLAPNIRTPLSMGKHSIVAYLGLSIQSAAANISTGAPSPPEGVKMNELIRKTVYDHAVAIVSEWDNDRLQPSTVTTVMIGGQVIPFKGVDPKRVNDLSRMFTQRQTPLYEVPPHNQRRERSPSVSSVHTSSRRDDEGSWEGGNEEELLRKLHERRGQYEEDTNLGGFYSAT